MPTRSVRLAIGVAPAVIGVAWFNAYLYGSPLVSGYGSLDALYSWRYLWTNVSHFMRWTLETQTPIVLVAPLFFVAPRWFDHARVPFPRVLLGGFMLAVVVSYVFYLSFTVWWFLRFLLPMWPVLMLSTALALDALMRRWPATPARLLTLACVVLAAWQGVRIADHRCALDLWRVEQRYVDVGRYFAAHTDPRAVAISVQQSGSIRHYGGRLTLRWDALDPGWLDRVVEHLAATGRHPYVVVDIEEVEPFRARFQPQGRVGALDWTPAAVLGRSRVLVFDAADRRARRTDVIPDGSNGNPGWRCDRPQRWPTPLRME